MPSNITPHKVHFWPGSGRGPITSIQSIRQSEHPSNKPAKVDSETTAGSVAGKRFTSFWSKSCSCWPIVRVAWFTGGRFWEVHRRRPGLGQEDFGGRCLLWHPAFWGNAFCESALWTLPIVVPKYRCYQDLVGWGRDEFQEIECLLFSANVWCWQDDPGRQVFEPDQVRRIRGLCPQNDFKQIPQKSWWLGDWMATRQRSAAALCWCPREAHSAWCARCNPSRREYCNSEKLWRFSEYRFADLVLTIASQEPDKALFVHVDGLGELGDDVSLIRNGVRATWQRMNDEREKQMPRIYFFLSGKGIPVEAIHQATPRVGTRWILLHHLHQESGRDQHSE